jgi:hypothetical protein
MRIGMGFITLVILALVAALAINILIVGQAASFLRIDSFTIAALTAVPLLIFSQYLKKG